MGKLRIRSFLILCLLLAALGCTACQRARLPQDYRMAPFCATVAWQTGELELTAELETGAPVRSGGTVRLSLTSPETLRGIVLTRQEGVWSASCGGIETDASLLTEITDFAELLLPVGELVPVCETTLEGETVLYAELIHKTEEGEKYVYELYLEPESGVPREVCLGDRRLEIRRFEAGDLGR